MMPKPYNDRSVCNPFGSNTSKAAKSIRFSVNQYLCRSSLKKNVEVGHDNHRSLNARINKSFFPLELVPHFESTSVFIVFIRKPVRGWDQRVSRLGI